MEASRARTIELGTQEVEWRKRRWGILLSVVILVHSVPVAFLIYDALQPRGVIVPPEQMGITAVYDVRGSIGTDQPLIAGGNLTDEAVTVLGLTFNFSGQQTVGIREGDGPDGFNFVSNGFNDQHQALERYSDVRLSITEGDPGELNLSDGLALFFLGTIDFDRTLFEDRDHHGTVYWESFNDISLSSATDTVAAELYSSTTRSEAWPSPHLMPPSVPSIASLVPDGEFTEGMTGTAGAFQWEALGREYRYIGDSYLETLQLHFEHVFFPDGWGSFSLDLWLADDYALPVRMIMDLQLEAPEYAEFIDLASLLEGSGFIEQYFPSVGSFTNIYYQAELDPPAYLHGDGEILWGGSYRAPMNSVHQDLSAHREDPGDWAEPLPTTAGVGFPWSGEDAFREARTDFLFASQYLLDHPQGYALEAVHDRNGTVESWNFTMGHGADSGWCISMENDTALPLGNGVRVLRSEACELPPHLARPELGPVFSFSSFDLILRGFDSSTALFYENQGQWLEDVVVGVYTTGVQSEAADAASVPSSRSAYYYRISLYEEQQCQFTLKDSRVDALTGLHFSTIEIDSASYVVCDD